VAMTGTIALYDSQGERLHTIYLAPRRKYGKEEFHTRFVRELDRVKAQYPKIPYIGLSDGAADNWSFLSPMTDHQLLDFYHASEYVGKVAMAMFPGKKQADEREAWLADRLHRLKHTQGAAARLGKEMEEFAASHTIRVSRSVRAWNRRSPISATKASHELRLPYGSLSTDRKWRDGSRLQGADQTTLLQVGCPLERGGRLGGPVDSCPETNHRSLARLLENASPNMDS